MLLIFVNVTLYTAMANLHTYGWCLHYFVAVFFCYSVNPKLRHFTGIDLIISRRKKTYMLVGCGQCLFAYRYELTVGLPWM